MTILQLIYNLLMIVFFTLWLIYDYSDLRVRLWLEKFAGGKVNWSSIPRPFIMEIKAWLLNKNTPFPYSIIHQDSKIRFISGEIVIHEVAKDE